MTIRYIAELFSPNYALHTREYESLRHAKEDFADLSFATDSDELVLWHCEPHESAGERHGRTNELDQAAYRLSRGPRGGVKVESL